MRVPYREVVEFLFDEFDVAVWDFKEEKKDLVAEMCEGSEVFTIDFGYMELYFMHDTSEIKRMEIREYLEQDTYMLGCFADWFISDMTGLSLDVVQKAQECECYEVLGMLMMEHMDELVDFYEDDYNELGWMFAHYDGEYRELGNYLVFRQN